MSASQKFFVGFAATAIAGIGLLLYGSAKSKDFDLSIDGQTGELVKCPKTKLMAILEDM